MTEKLFELRDRGTFIPILAIRLNMGQSSERCRYLLGRAGYGTLLEEQSQHVLLMNLDYPERSHNSFYDWNDRTYQTAHQYIIENWSDLESGQVIDVEFILGETDKPKQSEMFSEW